MARPLFRAKLLIALIAIHVLFALSIAFVDKHILITVLNGISLAIAIAVAFTFWKLFAESVVSARMTRVALLATGIFLTWIAFALTRVWSFFIRTLGVEFPIMPVWLISYIVFLAIIGGVLHLVAPAASAGVIPRRRWVMIGCVAAAGAAVSLLSLWLSARTGI